MIKLDTEIDIFKRFQYTFVKLMKKNDSTL